MTNTEERMDLYEFEKGRFCQLLQDDKPYAYKRYGLTLLYSLEPEEILQIRASMGWEGKEPLDYYNQGVLEAQKENLKEAMKLFRKAESMGCVQPELFFNIALILEKEENLKEAIPFYQKYIDACEKWDDIPKGLQTELDEAREHLRELKGDQVKEDE